MRLLALVLLASCSARTVGDTLLPDEFTLGHGRGTHTGGIQTHSPRWDYEGESETTYGALTWHLPSLSDTSISRSEWEDTREAALEASVADEGELQMNIREGVEPPPVGVLYAVAALLLLFVLAVAWKSRRNNQWH